MPMYDYQCECGLTFEALRTIKESDSAPCECGQSGKKVWLTQASAVIGDDIPGGLEIRHGLCHSDGSPRKFYSHSEIKKAAKEKGLVNYVTHVTAPGTDKSKHTSRWI